MSQKARGSEKVGEFFGIFDLSDKDTCPLQDQRARSFCYSLPSFRSWKVIQSFITLLENL